MVLCGLAYSYLEVWRAQRALNWPTADGLIVASSASLGCGRTGTSHYLIVRYKYRANGADREGRRILFGASICYSKSEAGDLVKRFPAGSVTTVRYDPDSPSESVLIAGKVDEVTWTGIYFMFWWLLLLSAATGMVVIVERSKRNPGRGLPPQRELGGGG